MGCIVSKLLEVFCKREKNRNIMLRDKSYKHLSDFSDDELALKTYSHLSTKKVRRYITGSTINSIQSIESDKVSQ